MSSADALAKAVRLGESQAGEEILFRGFVFRGWRRSRRDVWCLIVVTALL
jgi:hypothetical protein